LTAYFSLASFASLSAHSYASCDLFSASYSYSYFSFSASASLVACNSAAKTLWSIFFGSKAFFNSSADSFLALSAVSEFFSSSGTSSFLMSAWHFIGLFYSSFAFAASLSFLTSLAASLSLAEIA